MRALCCLLVIGLAGCNLTTLWFAGGRGLPCAEDGDCDADAVCLAGVCSDPRGGEGEGEGEGEGDPLFLRVTLSGQGVGVPADYPLLLRFDHAAMVAAGADVIGDDLRLLDGETPLGFALEPDGAFNTTRTGLWFRAPVPIAADGEVELRLEVGEDPSPRIELPFFGFEDFEGALGGDFTTSACDDPAGGAISCARSDAGQAIVLRSEGPVTIGKAIGFVLRVEEMVDDLVITEAHDNRGFGGAQSRYFAVKLSRDDEGVLQFGFRKHQGQYAEVDLQPYLLGSEVRVEFAVDFASSRARLEIEDRTFDEDIPASDPEGDPTGLSAFHTGVKDTDGPARVHFLHMYEREVVVPEPRVVVRPQ